MPAVNQFQRQLAFTNATFPGEQYTQSMHFHKNTVHDR